MRISIHVLVAKMRALGPSPSSFAGAITGACVVLIDIIVLEGFGFASFATLVPAVGIGLGLGLCICVVGTVIYWRRRRSHPEELDIWYISAFTLTVTAGMFSWPVLRGAIMLSPLLKEPYFGLPISLFLFILIIELGLVMSLFGLVAGGLIGTLVTAGVTLYYQSQGDTE